MSWNRSQNRAEEPVGGEELDQVLKQALGDFKTSVQAWSDAAYNRPRTVREVVVRRSRRLAAGWSLASMLIVGTLSVGIYEHHVQTLANIAAQRASEEQRQLAAQRARQLAQQEEEDLLASVDTEVSREVPSAMEPLVQLTDVSEVR